MEEKKDGIWFPEKIEGDELQEFANYLNSWADYDNHEECSVGNKLTEFGRGYHRAVSDIFDKLNIDWKQFDKRTKTGFRKQG